MVLLRRVGSPFHPLSQASEEPTVGQVALAWYILTRPWEEAAEGINTRRGKFTVSWFAIRRAGRHVLDGDAIFDWIASEAALPPFEKADSGSDDGERGTPHELLLAQALADQWNTAWPHVLAVSVAQANWLWLARWEERGVLTIRGDGGLAEDDALKRALDPDEAKRRREWAAQHEARLRASS
jgi:hypothetical protein